MRNLKGGMFVGLLVFLLSIHIVSGLDSNHLIANSERWEDVYSTALLASLSGSGSDFLTSVSHGPILLNSIPTSRKIGIITSKDSPFVFNYKPIVESRGYSSVEELEVDDANLELVDELGEINNFIIVDNSYGYSAIAVTPYAIITNSWVFLADRTNIAEIESIIGKRSGGKVIIYGYVEREVSDALEKYNPEVINTGDRFKDNVEIVKKYKEIKETRQVLLSNGEFIEKELMSGKHPVLFTGRDNVPNQIADYLQDSDISVGVLIGNELINAATNIRRTTGISVMVKFAQGARSSGGGDAVSAVEGLDLYYLPTPSLSLEIYSIKYNSAGSQVEVTYNSKSNIPIYLKGTLTLISDGDKEKIGDLEPVFIAPNSYKTLIYPDITLTGIDLKAEIFTLFGESPSSLDRKLEGSYDMGIISVIDKCEMDVRYVKYNKQEGAFIVGVKNEVDVDCYMDVELVDVRIDRISQTIGTEGSELVRAGKKGKIKIYQRMNDEDLDDNSVVDLVAYYGEREEILVKVFKGKFDLDIDNFGIVTYAIIFIIIILIILGLILIKLKRDKEW